jgi:hypothetical protein
VARLEKASPSCDDSERVIFWIPDDGRNDPPPQPVEEQLAAGEQVIIYRPDCTVIGSR